VDQLIHAGDVGSDEILLLLESIAPLTAVRGNMDKHGLAAALPARASVSVGSVRVLVQHTPLTRGEIDAVGEFDVVVHGHTHRPGVRREGHILIVNPGSARGNRGTGPGASVALLSAEGAEPAVRLVSV
jgi:putative phosphoesterase